jgi:hypothetical protein
MICPHCGKETEPRTQRPMIKYKGKWYFVHRENLTAREHFDFVHKERNSLPLVEVSLKPVA